MPTFEDLVASRKTWIAEVLIPWCRSAPLVELRKAADEWGDIAGRVDPEFSLWLWAWSRFPPLYVEGLRGLDESFEVEVTLHDGRREQGFPDARASRRGQLFLVGRSGRVGPFLIDQVADVRRVG
jgi:hypothetical protein